VVRPEKLAKVEEVRADLTGAAATLLTHYRGLSVTELAELRARLRESNAEMKVVKNTLTKRAAEAAGIGGLDELLEGPTSLVLCAEDPVGPAKALRAFAKDHPDLVIRGGYLDGAVLDGEAALKLADLESREELLAKLAGLMQGALSGTARLLLAATEKQARLLQALVDAGGPEAKGFSPSAPAAEAEPVPEAAAPAAEAEPAPDAAAPAAEAEPVPDAAEDEPASEAVDDEPSAPRPVADEAPAADETSAADEVPAAADAPAADQTTTEA
jgi:large subunit ribosomal protein L10